MFFLLYWILLLLLNLIVIIFFIRRVCSRLSHVDLLHHILRYSQWHSLASGFCTCKSYVEIYLAFAVVFSYSFVCTWTVKGSRRLWQCEIDLKYYCLWFHRLDPRLISQVYLNFIPCYSVAAATLIYINRFQSYSLQPTFI